MAVILRCFTEFGSFGDNHVTLVEDTDRQTCSFKISKIRKFYQIL